MTTNTTLDLTADIIDICDIIERVEELEDTLNGEDYHTDAELTDAQNELNALTAILEELKGYGGDEQWRGDWYPITLIRDSYFTDYAQELCHDIGDIRTQDFPSYIVIDWEATARNIRTDYSATEIDGVTYWYR